MPFVHLPAGLQDKAGRQARVEVPGVTVGEALAALAGRYPEVGAELLDARGGPRRSVGLFVGEDDVRDLDGLATPLAPRAVVLIVLAIAGG